MASSPRTEAREEERRLNMRTLVIASSASAAAAAVTSQLWIRGTWIAAAVTPVLVAIVSELLERPSARIARAVTSDSPALPASARPAPKPETREVEPPPLTTPGPGPEGPPVRVYRQPPPRRPRRRFALGLALGTAAIAFVIGVTVFTATELLAGESIGKSSGRTSLWSSDRSDENQDRETEQRDRTQPDTTERTAPDRPETQPTTPDRPETQPTTPSERLETQPTTPEETTPTTPAPADEPETEPAP